MRMRARGQVRAATDNANAARLAPELDDVRVWRALELVRRSGEHNMFADFTKAAIDAAGLVAVVDGDLELARRMVVATFDLGTAYTLFTHYTRTHWRVDAPLPARDAVARGLARVRADASVPPRFDERTLVTLVRTRLAALGRPYGRDGVAYGDVDYEGFALQVAAAAAAVDNDDDERRVETRSHAGAKRSIDLIAAAGLFDALPLALVRRLLVDGGVLAYDELASVNQATADTIRAATRTDGFFAELTRRCFARTTRLPFDAQHLLDRGYFGDRESPAAANAAWRAHLARLIALFAYVGVRIVNTRGDELSVTPAGAREPATCAELTAPFAGEVPLIAGVRYLAVFGARRRVVIMRVRSAPLGADEWLGVIDPVQPSNYARFRIEPAALTDDAADALIETTASMVVAPRRVIARPTVRVAWKNAYAAEPSGERDVARSTPLGDLFFADGLSFGRVEFKYGERTVRLAVSRPPLRSAPAVNDATLAEVLPPDVDRVQVLYRPLP